MPKNGFERERAELISQVRCCRSKLIVLDANAKHGNECDDEEPECIAVAGVSQTVIITRILEGRDAHSVDDAECRVHAASDYM